MTASPDRLPVCLDRAARSRLAVVRAEVRNGGIRLVVNNQEWSLSPCE